MLVSTIGFLIVLIVIVFVHEFGHYYAARKCGVKVEEFSIGFGKKIWGRIDNIGTVWNVRAIPLGGFVKLYGDDDDSLKSKDAYCAQTLVKKAIIIAAGPIANFMLAIMIFASIYFAVGRIEIKPFVGQVLDSSPGDEAGIVAGDWILKVNDKQISTFVDLRNFVASHPKEEMLLEIKRNNQVMFLKIIPSLKGKVGFIGIMPDQNHIRHINMGIMDSVLMAISDTYETSVLILESIGEMFFGVSSVDDISGMLTIAKESGDALTQGSLLLFIAFISINVGLLNLLPIPILDGGRLLFITYEGIMGKKLPKKMQSIAYMIGIWVIIFLVVISILNDIKSLLF